MNSHAVLFVLLLSILSVSSDKVTPQTLLAEKESYEVPCSDHYNPYVPGCHSLSCKRTIIDNFVPTETVDKLRELAEKGLKKRKKTGGPAILDLNGGYVRDGDGLVNIYTGRRRISFKKEEYDVYREVVESIRKRIMSEYDVKDLWFTAPTFITRIIGSPTWEAKEIHDEYWHEHVDKSNTEHYDYSGLLYLSDYGDDLDFTGGRFAFIDGEERHYVHPRRGRLIVFNAGRENLHQVQKVETGTRYCLSLWFTCNKNKYFKNFLDGKHHNKYSKGKESEGQGQGQGREEL